MLPRALLLAALAVAVPVTPAAAAERHWIPPVAGPPTRLFRLGTDPFARGQHRGVDFAASGPVRSACAGRVVFAGRVAGAGTVSVRCGIWRVSYAPLAHIATRAGHPVGPGSRLGRAAAGELHFGVRREGRRFGYVDPLRFLAGPRRAPPPVLPAPPSRARLPARPAAHPARPSAALAPWPVWLGLALLLTGVAGVGTLRFPFRRQEGPPCRASFTSNSSPTTPSSP
jgi:Peptidase family M23